MRTVSQKSDVSKIPHKISCMRFLRSDPIQDHDTHRFYGAWYPSSQLSSLSLGFKILHVDNPPPSQPATHLHANIPSNLASSIGIAPPSNSNLDPTRRSPSSGSFTCRFTASPILATSALKVIAEGVGQLLLVSSSTAHVKKPGEKGVGACLGPGYTLRETPFTLSV